MRALLFVESADYPNLCRCANDTGLGVLYAGLCGCPFQFHCSRANGDDPVIQLSDEEQWNDSARKDGICQPGVGTAGHQYTDKGRTWPASGRRRAPGVYRWLAWSGDRYGAAISLLASLWFSRSGVVESSGERLSWRRSVPVAIGVLSL